MGCEIVSCKSFGEYSGDHVYRVRRDGVDGILVVGFGSCSGCDALYAASGYSLRADSPEEDFNDVLALRARLEADIVWPDGATLQERFRERPQWSWWSFENEIRSYVQELARRVDEEAAECRTAAGDRTANDHSIRD